MRPQAYRSRHQAWGVCACKGHPHGPVWDRSTGHCGSHRGGGPEIPCGGCHVHRKWGKEWRKTCKFSSRIIVFIWETIPHAVRLILTFVSVFAKKPQLLKVTTMCYLFLTACLVHIYAQSTLFALTADTRTTFRAECALRRFMWAFSCEECVYLWPETMLFLLNTGIIFAHFLCDWCAVSIL